MLNTCPSCHWRRKECPARWDGEGETKNSEVLLYFVTLDVCERRRAEIVYRSIVDEYQITTSDLLPSQGVHLGS